MCSILLLSSRWAIHLVPIGLRVSIAKVPAAKGKFMRMEEMIRSAYQGQLRLALENQHLDQFRRTGSYCDSNKTYEIVLCFHDVYSNEHINRANGALIESSTL